MFLTPMFLKSTAYAFKDTIKMNSKGLDWDFYISNTADIPIMKNVKIDSSIIGYVYVFKYDENMFKDENTYQYKCYSNLVHIDVIEVCYKDILLSMKLIMIICNILTLFVISYKIIL